MHKGDPPSFTRRVDLGELHITSSTASRKCLEPGDDGNQKRGMNDILIAIVDKLK
jgi:hypothetical protein